MQKDLKRLLRDPNLIPSEKQTLLSNIAAQAKDLKMPCYLVGGAVRDLLLGKPVHDLDIVVEGDAIELGRALVKALGGKQTFHQKFHTAVWFPLDSTGPIDLITARKESYEFPGVLPTVIPSTIEDDLRRRDFPINSMAIRLDGDSFGDLLDPLNGQDDLEKGVIRILHSNSFVDDPTRIFRALRYESRYSFQIDSGTLQLINPESLAVLGKLSGERLRHELDLILEEEQAIQIIQRVIELGLSKAIHPRIPEFNKNYADYISMEIPLDISEGRIFMGYMLWFVNLSEDEIFSIANRLDFSNELTLSVWSGAQLKKSVPFLVNAKPSEWAFALEKLPLLSVYAVYLITGESPLLSYLSLWRHVRSRTTGDDLKARGLQSGPRYGEILFTLRSAWLDGEVHTRDEELDLLDKILQNPQ